MLNIDDKILKSLSPEEASIVSNLMSGLNELLSMNSSTDTTGVQNPAPAGVAGKADMANTGTDKEDPNKEKVETEEEKEEKAKKNISTTPAQTSPEGGKAPTGSSPATDNIDDQTGKEEEKNVEEVAKSLVQLLTGIKKPQPVQKTVNPVIAILDGVVKAQQKTSNDVEMLSNTIAKMLEGLGVVKQMEAVKKDLTKENSPSKPIMNADNEAVLKFINGLNSVVKKSQDNGNQEYKIAENELNDNSKIIEKNLNNIDLIKAFTISK